MATETIPVLDVRGEICPYPMLCTVRELDEERPGVASLDVLTDHPPALSTIPPEALKRGYGFSIEEERGGGWRIHLFREDSGDAPPEGATS
jgi:tRNA 2-thiouridine synthesizing protein A